MSFAKHTIQTVTVRTSLVFFTMAVAIINSRWLGPEGVGIIALLLLVNAFSFSFGNAASDRRRMMLCQLRNLALELGFSRRAFTCLRMNQQVISEELEWKKRLNRARVEIFGKFMRRLVKLLQFSATNNIECT